MDISFGNLGKSFPQNNVMPIGMLRHPRPVLQRIGSLGGSQTELGDSLIRVIITYLRVVTHVSNKHNFIHGKENVFTCMSFPHSKILVMEILAFGGREL